MYTSCLIARKHWRGWRDGVIIIEMEFRPMRHPTITREIFPVDEFLALYTRRRLVLDQNTGKFLKVNSCICSFSNWFVVLVLYLVYFFYNGTWYCTLRLIPVYTICSFFRGIHVIPILQTIFRCRIPTRFGNGQSVCSDCVHWSHAIFKWFSYRTTWIPSNNGREGNGK